MTFLRKLFAPALPPTPKETLHTTLRSLRIDSSSALPDNYHELLFTPSCNPNQVLTQLVHSLHQATSQAAIIKLYTIIMCAIRMGGYDEDLCSALDMVPQGICQGKQERVAEIEKSCRSFVAKMPSMADLYHSALLSTPNKNNPSVFQQHVALFRYLNHSSLLFPLLNTGINTAGRYYRDTLPFYKEFYRVWRAQVLLGYLQIKKMVDSLILNYKSRDAQIIGCFLDSVPEIELLCDQMESFITNKYFKGKNPNRKVYFSEETLQEMEYYLAESMAEGKKEEDFIRTADDDGFFGGMQ